MTQEEILEYNKRCAEFLGYKLHFIDEEKTQPYLVHNDKYKVTGGTILLYKGVELNFHSDWNWIMEVVEKIAMYYRDKKIPQIHLLNHPIFSPKEAVVQAINEFLIWYSNEKV